MNLKEKIENLKELDNLESGFGGIGGYLAGMSRENYDEGAKGINELFKIIKALEDIIDFQSNSLKEISFLISAQQPKFLEYVMKVRVKTQQLLNGGE